MDPLRTLRQGVLELSKEDGIRLIQEIRKERLKFPDGKNRNKKKNKKTTKKRGVSTAKKKPMTKEAKMNKLKTIMKGMTAQQRADFIASLS